jgi:hypothetical protein
LLEIIEIANQASQVISFGSERDFDWVIGVCFLLLLNSLFVPIPWLIAQYTNSQRTSKVVAAIGDLVFDTFFLLLALIVNDSNLSVYSSNLWGTAVFGFILPAGGALKTLHEVAQQASLEASSTVIVSTGESNLYFQPSKKCKRYADKGANTLSVFIALFGVVFSTYFLSRAFMGFNMCKNQLGPIVWHGMGVDGMGSSPKIVLSPLLEPICK